MMVVDPFQMNYSYSISVLSRPEIFSSVLPPKKKLNEVLLGESMCMGVNFSQIYIIFDSGKGKDLSVIGTWPAKTAQASPLVFLCFHS